MLYASVHRWLSGGYHRRDVTVVMPLMLTLGLPGVCCRLTRAAILASSPLHCVQLARRFSSAYHSPPSDTGWMWSTHVAWVWQPGSPIWHVWLSRWRMVRLMVRHCPRYTGLVSL